MRMLCLDLKQLRLLLSSEKQCPCSNELDDDGGENGGKLCVSSMMIHDDHAVLYEIRGYCWPER